MLILVASDSTADMAALFKILAEGECGDRLQMEEHVFRGSKQYGDQMMDL
jgi:hypothetical protein